MNPCKSCSHCLISSRSLGYCHRSPPTPTFLRLVKLDGQEAIDPRENMWIQLAQVGSMSMYPPVTPTESGCSRHKFSLLAWFRWWKAKDLPLPPMFVQKEIK